MQSLLLKLSGRVERAITGYCTWAFRHPWLALALLLAVFLPLASQLPKLQRDGSIEGFFKAGDPQLVAYDKFRRQFGQDGQIVVGVSTEGSVFEPDFIDRLSALHHALQAEVPHLEDISSLVNARDVKGTDDSFVVDELLATRPANPQAWAAFERKARQHPVYPGLLFSADGKFTLVMLKPDRFETRATTEGTSFSDAALRPDASGRFLGAESLGRVVAQAEAVAQRFDAPGFRVYVAGSPVASATVVRLLGTDMGRYMLLSVGVILLLITVLTRRASAALLAALVIALTLFSTFGLMAAGGSSIKPPTQVLLSIILVASVCELIHIVTVFYQRLQAGDTKEAAITHTAKHTAMPVVYTSITTAAGIAAFCVSPMAPVADLGFFGAVAVLLAMAYTWTVTAIGLRWLRVRPRSSAHGEERAYRWTVRLAGFSHRHPWAVVSIAAPVLVVLGIGVSQVRFSHNALLWLPEAEPARVATGVLDGQLKGSVGLEIVVDTGVVNGVQRKAFLDRINAATDDLRRLGSAEVPVGKVIAVTDVIKEITQALHAGDTKHFVVPDEALVRQAFTLFENSSSDDIHDFVDTEYRLTRITVRLPWLEARSYTGYIDKASALMAARFPEAKVSVTGNMALLAQTSSHVMSSMASSYLSSMVTIPLLMALLLASVRLGVLSMVPNLVPIFAVLGLMGFLGMPLDTFSMLAGSIALGLIVDDSVHFFYNFSRFKHKLGDVGRALTATVEATGRSMVNASVVLSAAFASFVWSDMHNVQNFGIVMVTTIVLAMVSDLLLSPAILTLAHRRADARRAALALEPRHA